MLIAAIPNGLAAWGLRLKLRAANARYNISLVLNQGAPDVGRTAGLLELIHGVLTMAAAHADCSRDFASMVDTEVHQTSAHLTTTASTLRRRLSPGPV